MDFNGLCIRKITILPSKTLLVGIFSRPEIGRACSLSDANCQYLLHRAGSTFYNTFHRELPPLPRAGMWKCIEMTFGKRKS